MIGAEMETVRLAIGRSLLPAILVGAAAIGPSEGKEAAESVWHACRWAPRVLLVTWLKTHAWSIFEMMLKITELGLY